MQASMLEGQLKKLRQAYSAGDLVIVAGAGVSFGATGGTSKTWPGLIQHALEYAKDRCRLTDEDKTDCRMIELCLGEKQPGTLLHAASIAQSLLVRKRQFPTWLNNVFGDLSVKNDSLLQAIKRLQMSGALLVTTNYDHVLDDYCGLNWIGPAEHDKILRFIDKSREGVLHVHGEYDDPSNVVMSAVDYYRIRTSADIQLAMKSFLTNKTVVFVGCGSGLEDPNFGKLIEWAAEQRKNLPDKHYMLVRNKEKGLYFPSIQRVEYGDDFDKLAPFLNMIVEERVVSGVVSSST